MQISDGVCVYVQNLCIIDWVLSSVHFVRDLVLVLQLAEVIDQVILIITQNVCDRLIFHEIGGVMRWSLKRLVSRSRGCLLRAISD